jgi:hypothetical protein
MRGPVGDELQITERMAGLCGGRAARALRYFGRTNMHSLGWDNVKFHLAEVSFAQWNKNKTKQTDAAD